MKVYGYARCSTKDKQDIGRQIRDLTAIGVTEIYKDYASGTDNERPELGVLLANIQTGDTLATTEVSRLTRSLHHLCHILDDAEAKKYRVTCGTLTADFTESVDPMSKSMLQIMGVFAELERGLTVGRIKSGLENAKAKGSRLGRPKKKAKDVPSAVSELLSEYQDGRLTKVEFAKKAGISRTALYKYLRLLGVKKDRACPLEPPAEKKRGRPVMVKSDVPLNVVALLPEYRLGNINKTEYAKQAGVSRPTLDKYLRILGYAGE